MLKPLPYAMQCKFPVSLTYKYAVDKSLITMLRSRTLGNKPTAHQANICELHSEKFLRQTTIYLQDCLRHRDGISSIFQGDVQHEYEKVKPFKTLPTAQWFLSTYARDVMDRKESLKGTITSVFGEVLKIDSTKKILKKLSGDIRGSANWVTNVGNEYGGILQSVLTTSESNESLKCMADGLIKRYEDANVDPPRLLYTDRDCCNENGASKYQLLFKPWDLTVRLDMWHFMRRIATGCSSESHPLYGIFMSQLSGCIFTYDEKDYNLLLEAKREELKATGLRSLSDEAVKKSVMKTELNRHCKRKTRGYLDTMQHIDLLMLEFTAATDVLGVPLFNADMMRIWKEQKRHLECIQDPGISLYTQTGTVKKGGRTLPIYRCARGSTSLESFHRHLLNFFPGTSANAVNFQAYLLDGLSRWNIARKEAISPSTNSIRSFDQELIARCDQLHVKLMGKPFISKDPSSANTDELIGIEYLYSQCTLPFTDEYINNNIEDGVDSGIDVDDFYATEPEDETLGDDLDLDIEEPTEDQEEDDSVDAAGIPGWGKVDKLVKALVSQTGISIPTNEACELVKLYYDLPDHDKKALVYRPIKMTKSSGRFGRKKSGHVGVVAMKRCFTTGGSPALPSSRSRLVEAICIHLCSKYANNITITVPGEKKKFQSRWKSVLCEYNNIRARLFNTLFNINETTLMRWHKSKPRLEEVTSLMHGKDLPGNLKNTTSTPSLRNKPNIEHFAPLMVYPEPEDRTGWLKSNQND